MTKQEKIAYAKKSIAASIGRGVEIFGQDKNVFIESGDDDGFFTLIHFDGNAVIIADKAILGWCIENFADVSGNEIVKGAHYAALTAKLREHGKELRDDYKDISHMRLEDVGNMETKEYPEFEFEIYEKDRLSELEELYEKEIFSQALDKVWRNEVFAIVAHKDGDIVAAVSCCDAYKEAFRQINVDTLAEHRGRGLATHLVMKISQEIESRGHVPLYTTWETNTASMHVAKVTGFSPVWLWCYGLDIE